jgi:uncharacterized protein YndB with AHSA1/START domain
MEQATVHVSALIPARAARVYGAWLDGKEHGSFVGGKETTVEARVGGRIETYGGTYRGKITKLRSGSHISQTLRSDDFPEDAPDSRLSIDFIDRPDGTAEMVIHQTDVPDFLVGAFETHWIDHYVSPMRMYFAALPEVPAAPAPAPKPRSKKDEAPAASKKKAGAAKRSTKAAAPTTKKDAPAGGSTARSTKRSPSKKKTAARKKATTTGKKKTR